MAHRDLRAVLDRLVRRAHRACRATKDSLWVIRAFRENLDKMEPKVFRAPKATPDPKDLPANKALSVCKGVVAIMGHREPQELRATKDLQEHRATKA